MKFLSQASRLCDAPVEKTIHRTQRMSEHKLQNISSDFLFKKCYYDKRARNGDIATKGVIEQFFIAGGASCKILNVLPMQKTLFNTKIKEETKLEMKKNALKKIKEETQILKKQLRKNFFFLKDKNQRRKNIEIKNLGCLKII